MIRIRPIVLSLVFFGFFLLALPDQSYAQIVPCNGPNCQTCHFIQLGNNLLRWIIGAMVSICGIVIVVAGFKLVMSGSDSGARSSAKGMITNAIIGFIILLAAWLIVDTVLRTFVGGTLPGFGPWNQIQCVTQPTVTGTVTPTPVPGTVTAPTTTAQCTDDAGLMAAYRGSPVGVEASGLRPLINCYLADPQVAAAVDNGQIFTVDNSRPRCSLTNGNSICGACSHSNNSCHYGRGSGEGARAVDFNARAGFSETELFNRIQARRSVCGGVLNFETNHTHINMSGC